MAAKPPPKVPVTFTVRGRTVLNTKLVKLTGNKKPNAGCCVGNKKR